MYAQMYNNCMPLLTYVWFYLHKVITIKCVRSYTCINLTKSNKWFNFQGATWHGCSGVHTHMTNTGITGPELLEKRYFLI